MALYFLTAWRCGSVAITMYARKSVGAREFFAWTVMTGLCIFLGVNKQLDLQSAVTEIGRALFYRPDRIAYKPVIQYWFLVFISALAALAAVVIATLIWKTHLGTWIALLGTLMVITYVLIRATSFHALDRFIQSNPLYALKWNWIIEISGILMVLLATFVRGRALSRVGYGPSKSRPSGHP